MNVYIYKICLSIDRAVCLSIRKTDRLYNIQIYSISQFKSYISLFEENTKNQYSKNVSYQVIDLISYLIKIFCD